MQVDFEQLVRVVAAGRMGLVGESAGYLMLAAADQALQRGELAELQALSVNEDGTVALSGTPAEEVFVEASLRASLARLLSFVRIPQQNLVRVAERRERRGVENLVAEIEAALVPVNRRAARRALGRLAREVSRHLQAEKAAGLVLPKDDASRPIAQMALPPDADDATTSLTIETEIFRAERGEPPQNSSVSLPEPSLAEAASHVPPGAIKEERTRLAVKADVKVSPEVDEFGLTTDSVNQSVNVGRKEPVASDDEVSLEPHTNQAAASSVSESSRYYAGVFRWKSPEALDPDLPLIDLQKDSHYQPKSVLELLGEESELLGSLVRIKDQLRGISPLDHSPTPPPLEI
ncbi:MAG: hypothetical protein MK135_15855 [Polyangiaceae bacterium]|nr:hypothetical protein [Polyangiaceae bacterium]